MLLDTSLNPKLAQSSRDPKMIPRAPEKNMLLSIFFRCTASENVSI